MSSLGGKINFTLRWNPLLFCHAMSVTMAHESRKHNTCELVFAQFYEKLYQKEQIVGYYKTIL
jgi:hypothetical protein